VRSVMITGDNPLTAATIAKKSGVDDFVAQCTPESKLAYIRKEQADGKLVAMIGDGTNDAPALAQADVGLAMNSSTQAAKEAGNMVDFDSNPTKAPRGSRNRQAAPDDARRTDDLLDRQ
jgi:potassium-transporting ATPase ATP-binding subunit